MRLYCVLYKDGTVKAGRSGWIRHRMLSLARNGTIVKTWHSEEILGPIIETMALKRMRRIANTTKGSRERFYGLPFNLAVHICKQTIGRVKP